MYILVTYYLHTVHSRISSFYFDFKKLKDFKPLQKSNLIIDITLLQYLEI